jgi:ankyrin repeat protein
MLRPSSILSAITSRGDWTQALQSKTLYRDVVFYGHRVDTTEIDVEGRSVLHAIAILDDMVLLSMFMPQLEDMAVDLPDCWNSTALHYSARNTNTFILRHLIHMNANINAVNIFGNTPLHNAARNRRMDAVEILLAAGARTDIRNKAKYTFLDYLQMPR